MTAPSPLPSWMTYSAKTLVISPPLTDFTTVNSYTCKVKLTDIKGASTT